MKIRKTKWRLRLKAVGELGARLSAAMDVTPRPSGTIRVHRHVEADLDMLYGLGMVDAPLRAFLRASVLAGAKIFVSGQHRYGQPHHSVRHPTLASLLDEIPPQATSSSQTQTSGSR